MQGKLEMLAVPTLSDGNSHRTEPERWLQFRAVGLLTAARSSFTHRKYFTCQNSGDRAMRTDMHTNWALIYSYMYMYVYARPIMEDAKCIIMQYKSNRIVV